MSPLAFVLPLFLCSVLVAAATNAARTRWGRPHPSPPTPRPAPGITWLLAAAGASFAVLSWLANARTGELTVTVDMFVERGETVELYVNGTTDEPLRAAVVPGTRAEYRFETESGSIRSLRLDPTNSSDTAVRIYGVRVDDSGRKLAEWTASELGSWSRLNLSQQPTDPQALALVSTTADPNLQGVLNLVGPTTPPWVRLLVEPARDPSLSILLFLAGFLAFLAAGISDRNGLADAGAAAAVGLGAFPVARLLSSLDGAPPPVDQAVGMASYLGYPKFHDYLASLGVLALALVVGAAAARRGLAATREAPHGESEPTRSRRRWIVHAAVLLFVAVLFQPNLERELDSIQGKPYRLDSLDAGMNMTWDYALQRGSLPLRDFWFPYSGLFLLHLPLPWGHGAEWLHQSVVVGCLYVGLYLASGRRLAVALTLFGLLLAPLRLGEFHSWMRYLLAIDLTLIYVALELEPRRRRTVAAAFGLVAGYVLFIEPAQLIYGTVGIAALALASSLRQPGSTIRELPRTLGAASARVVSRIGVPLGAAALAVSGIYAAAGMAPGLLEFHASLGVQAVYGGVEADVSSWVAPLLSPDSAYLIFFMLIALAVRRWFAGPVDPRGLRMALLLVCGAGVLVMQKQAMRPHIMSQFRIYCCLGILLYAALVWPKRTRSQSIVAGLFIGAAVALAASQGALANWIYRVSKAPSIALENFDLLVRRRDETAAVSASRFTRARLATFVDEIAAVDRVRRRPGTRGEQALYVLGDNPVPYLLAGQDPPYHVTTFTGSPISEQLRTVAWLESVRPRAVLWDPADNGFDGVPHAVRTPLVYGFVVEHYVPAGAAGRFQILAARKRDSSRNARYWIRHLGSTVDLGHVVRSSDPENYPDCAAERCADVLVVDVAEPSPSNTTAAIGVRSGEHSWTVRFALAPDRRRYFVHADRLWFWRLATADGTAEIASATPGVSARLERRAVPPDVLY